MTQVIVVKNTDGSCQIIHPTAEALQVMTMEEIAAKDITTGLTFRICNLADLPADRSFREAWTDVNPTTTVDVDMVKAKSIHMDKIREARDEKLRQLDIETMKGVDVQAAKQLLRDLPQNTDLSGATTVEELNAIWPSEISQYNEKS